MAPMNPRGLYSSGCIVDCFTPAQVCPMRTVQHSLRASSCIDFCHSLLWSVDRVVSPNKHVASHACDAICFQLTSTKSPSACLRPQCRCANTACCGCSRLLARKPSPSRSPTLPWRNSPSWYLPSSAICSALLGCHASSSG